MGVFSPIVLKEDEAVKTFLMAPIDVAKEGVTEHDFLSRNTMY